MSPRARPSLLLHPAIPMAVIGVCVVFLIYAFFPIFQLVGQVFAVVFLLLAFRYWPPMTRWVRAMPVPHRVVFGVLLGSMILGHLTIRPRTYYPFIAWEIFPFVAEHDPVTCREFIATTASGKKVRLLVEQLFPSIIQIYPLDNLKHFPPATLDRLALTLAKAYNQHHADDPVRRVDLMTMAVQLHPPGNESRTQPSCELLKRYDF